MNILLMDLGNEFRGGQRQVLHLVRELNAERGRHAGLAAPVGSPVARKAVEQGLPLYPLPGHLDWDFRNLIALKRILRVGLFDVLHSNDARSASLGALTRLLTPDVKLVHTRRVSYPLKRGWSFRKYQVADLVVAVSRDIAESLAHSGIGHDKIEVVHSGIVPDAYQKSENAGAREEIVFGLIGAFTPQKGVEVFLKALAEIRRMRPEFRWLGLIVGEGPLGERLEDLAVELGIDDAVSFPGFVESKDVLCEIDVLVVPSMHGEGSSGTIKEGWAAGVPVVCSDLEANLELVAHEETGLVAQRGDEKALAESLIRLVEDRELAGRLKAEGEERVKEFTVRRMAGAYRRLYEDLVRGGGKAYPQA